MDGIEEKAIELIEKFEALAVDVAPDAIELGLMAARVAASSDALAIVAIAGVFFISLRTVLKTLGKDDYSWGESAPSKDGLVVIAGGCLTFFFGIGMLKEMSIWPFVGIFYPELWIAKQVLGW